MTQPGAARPRRKLRYRIAQIVFSLQSFVSASLLTPAIRIPVPVSLDRARAGERSSSLVIFLPGRSSRGDDFKREGFLAEARKAGISADLESADLHYGYYLKGISVERLWLDIVQPAREQGYRDIRLVGTSLGTVGAVGVARLHPEAIQGLILIAPFLGPDELVDEIRHAGGLKHWDPSSISSRSAFEAIFRDNWQWLKSSIASESPDLTLAFGQEDKFVSSQELMAEALSPPQVFRAPGGHRWATWRALWEKILASPVLSADKQSTSRPAEPSGRSH